MFSPSSPPPRSEVVPRWIPLLVVLFSAAGASPLAAQSSGNEQLESFVQEVARLWAAEDVDALVERTADSAALLLDIGSGAQTSSGRHTAAALRELFGDRQTLATSAVQVTVADADRPAGFGQLSWTYRDRGAPGDQTRSLYVAVAREGGRWTITELRLMP